MVVLIMTLIKRHKRIVEERERLRDEIDMIHWAARYGC